MPKGLIQKAENQSTCTQAGLSVCLTRIDWKHPHPLGRPLGYEGALRVLNTDRLETYSEHNTFMSEFFKELLTISGISLAIAFGQLFFTGHPGIWLTHFYLHLFQRQFPPSLGLGGLFIALVLSSLYPFGMIFGYLIGFRLVPALVSLTAFFKWALAIAVFFLWTLLMFELCYRWALSQAAR